MFHIHAVGGRASEKTTTFIVVHIDRVAILRYRTDTASGAGS